MDTAAAPDASPSVPDPEGLARIFRALRSRNYRIFFAGQGVSLVGTWMYVAAMNWLVYRLTGSKAWLGMQAFAAQLPLLLFSSLGGVVADRVDQRRLLVATQLLAMFHALALFVLVRTGVIAGAADIWALLALSVLLGVINAFDMPARQAFTVRMVARREDLPNAIALTSFLVSASRFAGPAAAGVLIERSDEATCFLADAVTFLAVVGALLLIRAAPRPEKPHRNPLAELAEGARYAWRTPAIRAVLLFLAAMSLVGVPYMVLLPVFARDILGGGAGMYGFLFGMAGAGSVVGTAFLASRRSPRTLGAVMATAGGLLGAALVAFSLSRAVWTSAAALVAAGFGFTVQIVAGNTLLQTVVEDDKRGRVMGLLATAFLGMMPFGGLLAGLAAERIGAPRTVLLCGLACLAAAAVFATQGALLRRALAEADAGGPEAVPPPRLPPAG